MATPSLTQLQHALRITEQIEKLEAELRAILSGVRSGVMIDQPALKGSKAKGKRNMSREARERIAAAQRARWAKSKGVEAEPETKAAKLGKKKRTMSPEARARIVAAQKARWAKFRKAKK